MVISFPQISSSSSQLLQVAVSSTFCEPPLLLISSFPVPMRKVLKVVLKTDGSVDPNDPLVQEAALKQVGGVIQTNMALEA